MSGQGARGFVGGLEALALFGRDAAWINSPTIMLGQAADATDRISNLLQTALGTTQPPKRSQIVQPKRSDALANQARSPTPPVNRSSALRSAIPQFNVSQNYALADGQALSKTILRAFGVDPPPARDFGQSTSQLIDQQPWLQDRPRNASEAFARLFGSLLPAAAGDEPAAIGPAGQFLLRGGRVALPALGATGARDATKAVGGTNDQQDVASLFGSFLGGATAGRMQAARSTTWNGDDLGTLVRPSGAALRVRQTRSRSEQSANTQQSKRNGQQAQPRPIDGSHSPQAQSDRELIGGPVDVNPTIQMGGPHRLVRGIPGYNSHHIVANSVSPIPKNRGLAIGMSEADHANTVSYGSSAAAKQFRARQKELIEAGDHESAHRMGIDDIKSSNGGKYDRAIEQLDNYNLDGSPKK